MGTLDHRNLPTYGQVFFPGAGREAHLGLAVEDLRDDVFNAAVVPTVDTGPLVCTHHPCFLTRSTAGLHPLTVHVGELVIYNGPHQLEVVKEAHCDGHTRIMWALGSILPPTRWASCWQLVNKVPLLTRTKEEN